MALEVYRATVSGSLAREFVQTVVHFQADNTASVPAYELAKSIAEDMVAAGHWIDLYMSLLCTSYKASSLRVKKVSAGGGPEAVVLASLFTQDTGPRSGEISSAQASPLIILIPNGSPSKVGKIFMPGISESDINEMSYEAGYISAFEDFVPAITEPQTGALAAYEQCVFRRTAGTGDQISYARLSPLVGTLRKRLHPV